MGDALRLRPPIEIKPTTGRLTSSCQAGGRQGHHDHERHDGGRQPRTSSPFPRSRAWTSGSPPPSRSEGPPTDRRFAQTSEFCGTPWVYLRQHAGGASSLPPMRRCGVTVTRCAPRRPTFISRHRRPEGRSAIFLTTLDAARNHAVNGAAMPEAASSRSSAGRTVQQAGQGIANRGGRAH